MERLEKEVDDIRRLKLQAESELRSQEELNASKRQEVHALEMNVKKNESTISMQQERIRTLAETIEIAEKRSQQAIETFQAETDSKLKAIRHEFETDRIDGKLINIALHDFSVADYLKSQLFEIYSWHFFRNLSM